MEAPVQTPDGGGNDNSWVIILLSAIGVYLLFKKKKTVDVDTSSSDKIDSYSKFKNTAMGQSIDDEIIEEGIELSASQIMLLDKCLQGLTDEQHRVLEKASGFVKKEDLIQALTKEELKTFQPVRKKIMDCIDETINR